MLCDDIRELTDRALWETENLIKSIPDNIWDKRYDGIPVWKYLYHTLYSLDRWYIDPYDPEYLDPAFHQAGLNDLNVVPGEERVERAVMEDYFYQVRDKIRAYIGTLRDDMLAETPENCGMSRLRLIIGQIRHWHRHQGIIYAFIIGESGKWPLVLNMNGKYPEADLPVFYD